MINRQDELLIIKLKAVTPKLPSGSVSFAGGLCESFRIYGSLTENKRAWVHKLIARAETVETPETAAVRNVGDLTGILNLFAVATEHLKSPAIELTVPGFEQAIRVSVATDRSRFPGSLSVLSAARDQMGDNGFMQRTWFGRVMQSGVFTPGRAINASYRDAVVERLREFARDPAKVASEEGKLNGRCCFCRQSLKDARSTAVGYGKTCARNFGVPWGAVTKSAILTTPPHANTSASVGG